MRSKVAALDAPGGSDARVVCSTAPVGVGRRGAGQALQWPGRDEGTDSRRTGLYRVMSFSFSSLPPGSCLLPSRHSAPAMLGEHDDPLSSMSTWAPQVSHWSGVGQKVHLLQFVPALQTFCTSLISADVSELMLDVLHQDTNAYTRWMIRQSGMEQLLDLIVTATACALSDAWGRRPLLVLTGPLELCLWAAVGAWAPRVTAMLPVVAFAKALSSCASSAFVAVSASAICDAVGGDPEALAESAAVSQSYIGLSVIFAPLISVFLRKKVGERAPFQAAVLLSTINFFVLLKCVRETLEPSARVALRAESLNPLGASTLLLRQTAPVSLLAAMYSMQSMTRCVDVYLQPFSKRQLGWGRNEVAQLLSFWGACVFIGSRGVKEALRRLPAHKVILFGTLCSAADFALRSLTTRWWHHPAALIVGLPGLSVEAAMRAYVTGVTHARCPHIGRGAVQAALRTQQALTVALLGSPLFGRAFAGWLRGPRGSVPARHYVLASASGVVAHLLLWAALFQKPGALPSHTARRK